MKDETKSVLGIAYLYTLITVIFLSANYLMALIFSYDDDNAFNNLYIVEFLILFVFYAVIGLVLYKLNKKQNQSLGAVFKNNTIRKTVGILILISCLISLILYIPALSYAVSQIINNSDDGAVFPNIISFATFLVEFLIAILFLMYNNKTASRNETNVVLGIAFLYILITYSFYLVSKLSYNVILHSSIKQNFYIRLASTAIVLIVLYIANRKHNQCFISIFQNGIIRKSSGALILIDGLISLSGDIKYLSDLIYIAQFNGGIDRRAELSIIQDVVSILIFIFQILFGIYMLKYFKNKGLNE